MEKLLRGIHCRGGGARARVAGKGAGWEVLRREVRAELLLGHTIGAEERNGAAQRRGAEQLEEGLRCAMERGAKLHACCRGAGRKKRRPAVARGRRKRVAAKKFRGVGLQNNQVQGERAPIYRHVLGLGFLSGPLGLEWAWPKTCNRLCQNIFRNEMLLRKSSQRRTERNRVRTNGRLNGEFGRESDLILLENNSLLMIRE
jgi:hypothetical protein